MTVVDMDAGLEHLKRGTAQYVDVMLITVEPYYKSLETANRIRALAEELGIKRVLTVANKIRNPVESQAVEEFCSRHNLNLIASIPYDEAFMEAEKLCISPVDYNPNAKGVAEMAKLVEVLQKI